MNTITDHISATTRLTENWRTIAEISDRLNINPTIEEVAGEYTSVDWFSDVIKNIHIRVCTTLDSESLEHDLLITGTTHDDNFNVDDADALIAALTEARNIREQLTP